MDEMQQNVSLVETRTCKHCGKVLPIDSFYKNRWGYTTCCKECKSKITSEARKNSISMTTHSALIHSVKEAKLSNFTSRELIEELAKRGYKGKLEITETKVIDITNF